METYGELIVQVATVATSVIALWYTYRSVEMQKQHNYRSLQPLLWLGLGNYEQDLYVQIENHGIGPMIIKSFRAYNEETPSQAKSDLIGLMPQGITWNTFIVEFKDRCIKSDGKLIVLKWSGSDVNRRDEIRKSLSVLTIEIEIEDVYGRPMPLIRRRLDWFGHKQSTL